MKSDSNIIGSSLAEAGAGLSSGLRSLLEQTNKTAKGQLTEAAHDAEKQIFALEGDLSEGEEKALSENKTETKKQPISVEHQAYFREVLAAPIRRENEDRAELKAQIEEIRIEIKKLKDASTEMEIVFREVSREQTPEKPGKYHLNFYEWVFLTIKNARQKMEEVNTLGGIFQSRKREKQYMAMSKKHGTSYSMHHDRSIARQTG